MTQDNSTYITRDLLAAIYCKLGSVQSFSYCCHCSLHDELNGTLGKNTPMIETEKCIGLSIFCFFIDVVIKFTLYYDVKVQIRISLMDVNLQRVELFLDFIQISWITKWPKFTNSTNQPF